MTTTPEPPESRQPPVELPGVPDEEGIDPADAAERVDKDPDEQENQEELR